ncbi:NIPSNAP-domain-containing protein, partial [Fistulina hepatica ATCC 64428]
TTQSILHGSPEARKEAEQQYSRIVARGKYVHGFEVHRVKPDMVDQYKETAAHYYTGIAQDGQAQVKLTGSWETVVGELDLFFHILEYENFKAYEATAQYIKTSDHLQAYRRMLPYLTSRQLQLNALFAFMASEPTTGESKTSANKNNSAVPDKVPPKTGGIFELRTYQLESGRLLEWENAWRRGLDARRAVASPVGAWYAQIGRLHQVYHLWRYESLEVRKETRERAWQADGWAETVSETAKLAKIMDSYILEALPYSPLK